MSKKEQKFMVTIDGRIIGYNVRVNNVYFNKNGYCVKDNKKDIFYKIDSKKQLMMGYFIYDIEKQRLYNPAAVFDGFICMFQKEIENKKVEIKGDFNKYVIIAGKKEIVKVKDGNIIGVNFQKTVSVSNGFLRYDTNVNHITMPSVKNIGHSCFDANKPMKMVLEKIMAKNNGHR